MKLKYCNAEKHPMYLCSFDAQFGEAEEGAISFGTREIKLQDFPLYSES